MNLILSKDPTGEVLSWQMSADRASPCDGGYKHTTSFKTYGGNTERVTFFLKGATKKMLKKVRKWRIVSATIEDQAFCLTLTAAEKNAKVDILQITGRATPHKEETTISFLSPSRVHTADTRAKNPQPRRVSTTLQTALA